MTPNEIQMLLCGIALGVQLMAVLHMVWDMRDARRSQTRAEAAAKRAAGDHYINSLRLYQIQHRSRV